MPTQLGATELSSLRMADVLRRQHPYLWLYRGSEPGDPSFDNKLDLNAATRAADIHWKHTIRPLSASILPDMATPFAPDLHSMGSFWPLVLVLLGFAFAPLARSLRCLRISLPRNADASRSSRKSR